MKKTTQIARKGHNEILAIVNLLVATTGVTVAAEGHVSGNGGT
jgi:hypothetical protein